VADGVGDVPVEGEELGDGETDAVPPDGVTGEVPLGNAFVKPTTARITAPARMIPLSVDVANEM
jgi:hypothetical protein